MNDLVRFNGQGVSSMVVFASTSRAMNILNASVNAAVATDWRFTDPGADTLSSIFIGASGVLSLYPVPVLGVGTPGLANPMRLTGESMMLGFNPASTGQFIANAELAAVDLTLHGNLTVGNQSTGLFSLFNGAKASVGGAMNIGQLTVGAPRTDTVLLQGAGTALTVPNGRINIARFGNAQFTVRDGASSSSLKMGIGSGSGSNGTALVFGANSQLTTVEDLIVGDLGTGSLTIRLGAHAATSGGYLGNTNSAAQGTVTVQNAGSRWDITGSTLVIGSAGRGVLNIEDQAIVTAVNGAVAGVVPGSQATITLGNGARLEVAQELVLGGGFVTAGGTASLVAGAGSTLTAGTLQFYPGSTTDINGGTFHLGRAVGTGTVNFNSGTINFTGGDVTVGESSLLPSVLQILPSRNFNFTNGLIVPSGKFLRVSGGYLTAGSVSIQPGGLFGATVNFTLGAPVENRSTLEGPTAAGSWLTLTGDVRGEGQCLNSVAFAAGYFPGAFGPARPHLRNARCFAASTLHLNLGGLASNLRDSLDVTEALTLEGSALTVALTGGFTPAAGDEFDLLDFASVSGTFSAVNLPTLPDNLYWNTSALYTTGRISVGLRVELRLAGISTQPGNSLLVQGSGQPGDNFSLEASADLVNWNWRANLIADAGGTWQFLDSGVMASTRRMFYRAHGEPSLPRGLVSLYHADVDYRDSFGPNNGVQDATSPAFGIGKKGLAFGFNGTSHSMNIGAAAIAPEWTAAMWVNRRDSPDASAALLWERNAAGVGSALKLEQFGTAGRRVGFTRFGVADYAFNYSAPVNTWTHLAFVGTSGSTTLYVNGLASGTIAAGIPLPMQRLGDPTGDRLKGLVDELLIFNRALSPVEIQQVRDATGTP